MKPVVAERRQMILTAFLILMKSNGDDRRMMSGRRLVTLPAAKVGRARCGLRRRVLTG
jgi:hypothetical protein